MLYWINTCLSLYFAYCLLVEDYRKGKVNKMSSLFLATFAFIPFVNGVTALLGIVMIAIKLS